MNLVVLGRDGVINRIPGNGIVADPADWMPLAGSLRAIPRLCHARWRGVVVTRQPGLADGCLDLGLVEAGA